MWPDQPIKTLAFALLLACCVVSAVRADNPSPRGTADHTPLFSTVALDDFALPGPDGRTVTWSRDPSVKLHVFCFLGTECPLARIYGPRLQQMSDDFAEQGVQFLGIVSNVQDSIEEMGQYARDHGINFPLGKDYDQRVTTALGATRTPEVFVVDRGGSIRYQGRIDDQYQPGISRSEATQHDLRLAIEALLAGSSPAEAKTEAVGCLIGRHRDEPTDFSVTFCDQVVRVLRRHCIECHREGEIGPFSLEDFDEVVGWGDMCVEVVDQGRMPPWHASPEFGSFANSRHMPQKDKQVLRHWVDAGMPYGDPDDLPPPADYVEGWRLPEAPHVVLPMREEPFEVPAEGTVEYQYFVVDPGFEEDKWVRAAEVIPGCSSVVHHCIAFTRPPDGASFREIGLLSAFVPGQVRSPLPEGYAQRIPAGSRIVFQMHYTPNGKVEHDLTRLGLVFADPKDVTHEVIALGGIQQEFEIPPRTPRHVVDGRIGWFPRDGMLLSIMPHMHLRGKAFEFRIERGEQSETVLQVPAYDFNWQHNYELTSPLPLNDVDELSFSAIFDNSSDNPFNPDPSELVTWGDQTWQEMAVTFISVARPLGKGRQQSPTDLSTDEEERISEQLANQEQRAREFADRYIGRFDDNGDGFVTRNELPHSVRIFSYWQLDADGDGRISRDEIYRQALARYQDG